MIFKKPKLKSILFGSAITFLLVGPLFLSPNQALAAGGAEIYPKGINITSTSDRSVFKITKAEVNTGTVQAKDKTLNVNFKLESVVDLKPPNTPLDGLHYKGDANPDTIFPSTSSTNWGGYFTGVKAVIVSDLTTCAYPNGTQWGTWDKCSETEGVANMSKSDTVWKVGDSITTPLPFDYNTIAKIKDSAKDASVKTTQTFSVTVVPTFVLSAGLGIFIPFNIVPNFSLTTTANPDLKPLIIKIMLFVDDAARTADTTPDTPATGSSTGQGSGTTGSTIGNVLNTAVTYLVLTNTRIIYWLFSMVLAPLIESLLQIHPYTDIFVNAIYLGWQLIRNLCNIFFIVVLLVIGLGTLFRVESFNYKHLLVKVVIAALLVNFSLVFGQAILGVADTVQQQFLPDSQNVIRALGSKLMVEPINDLTKDAGTDTTTAGASFGNIAKPVFAFALALGAFFTFIALAAFLVIRLVALWILLLVSPLAYVANILPQTKSYADSWWKNFLKYAIMTPVLAFFLNLSAVFVTTVGSRANLPKLLTSNGVSGDISQLVYIAGSQVLTILFILVGLKAAQSTGTYGAAAITNFAEKGMRKPFEWAGKAGLGAAALAGAGTKLGAERGFEGLQNKMGMTLDPRLIKKAGSEYFAEQKAKRLQARATRPLFGREGNPKFGDAKSNFEAYANWRGFKRATWQSRFGTKGAGHFIDQSKGVEPYTKLKTDKDRGILSGQMVNNNAALVVPRAQEKQLKEEISRLESQYSDPKNMSSYNNPNVERSIKEKSAQLSELQNNEIAPLIKKNKEIVGELQKDTAARKALEVTTFSSADKSAKIAEMKEYDAKVNKLKRPEGYAAIAAHHHLLSEEKKKIEHIDEADRLIQLYKDAKAQGERYKAEAIMQKLAKDVNFNELLESEYGKNDYNTFVKHFKDNFAKDFNVSQHEALEAMSEVSYINEGVHMYNTSRAIEIDKHGHMGALNEQDHNKIIATQMKKVEAQAQARQFWRGAFVDEELNDHDDISKGKTFKLHSAGIEVLQSSLAKGEGIKHVATRMQEYNRKAILDAINKEMENPNTARKEVRALHANRPFMDALEHGDKEYSSSAAAKKRAEEANADDEIMD